MLPRNKFSDAVSDVIRRTGTSGSRSVDRCDPSGLNSTRLAQVGRQASRSPSDRTSPSAPNRSHQTEVAMELKNVHSALEGLREEMCAMHRSLVASQSGSPGHHRHNVHVAMGCSFNVLMAWLSIRLRLLQLPSRLVLLQPRAGQLPVHIMIHSPVRLALLSAPLGRLRPSRSSACPCTELALGGRKSQRRRHKSMKVLLPSGSLPRAKVPRRKPT